MAKRFTEAKKMKKDAFYFSHDTNASGDPNMVLLIMAKGMEGYGIYWRIIELLHESGGWYPKDYERIAFVMRWQAESIKEVIEDFSLFKFKENSFTSERVLRNIKNREEKSKQARINAFKRYGGNADADQAQNRRTAKKERKGKEKKEYRGNFKKPLPGEVTEYGKTIDFHVDGEKFCDYYESRGWKIKGSAIKDWKACVRTWKKNGFETSSPEKEHRLPTAKELGL